MAKKKVEPKKKTFEIPKTVLDKLKIIKKKFYKEETISDLKKIYKEKFDELKEKYINNNWSDAIIHKRTITAIKNTKKRENLGGAVEQFIGVLLGSSKIRDLSSKRRSEILDKYQKDPHKAINEGLIMTRDTKNPQTGEIEKEPLTNKNGDIIPRDNREFFQRKDGSKWKNPNHTKSLPRSMRKNVIGITRDQNGIIGISLIELRDSQTEINVPLNCIVKFTCKKISANPIKMKENKYLNQEYIEDFIESIKMDIEEGILDEESANTKIKLINEMMDKTIEQETYLYKLRSSRGTRFIETNKPNDIEFANLPMKKDGSVNIDLLYKEYLFAFNCDCSNLLLFHYDNQYIDEDPEKINWDEFVSIQDANVLQCNMEVSMSGNYTMQIDDESLLMNEVELNGEIVDSIRVLIPSTIKIDFGQDSKVHVIGNIVQFQKNDDDNKPIFEEEENEKGETVKIPVLDYPTIFAYNVYAIPEYKIEVQEIDMGEMEEEMEEFTKEHTKEDEETTKEDKNKPEEEVEETEEEHGDEDEVDENELW